jgi:SAM-dependent methyltransferase
MDPMLDATAAAEDRHFWFKGLRRSARVLLAHALAGRQPNLIIDCGSGTGRNLDWLSRMGPAVGVELSPTGLDHGRRHGRRLVRGSVTALPFADNSADIATSFDVLYMLEDADERQALREMYRVLRPGGVAIFNVAALDTLRGSHSVLTRERRRYTRDKLRARLLAAGFAVERLTFTNMTVFPVTWSARLFERATGRADTASTSDLGVPAAPVNAAFDALLGLEAAWLRIGNLPIGSSILAIGRKTSA